MSTQILYDNDIHALSRTDAVSLMTHPDQLLDVLVREDGRVSDVSAFLQISAFLQTLGVSEQKADNIGFNLLGKQHTDEQSRQAFFDAFAQSSPTEKQQDVAISFLSQVLEDIQHIKEEYQERQSAELQDNLEKLGIHSNDIFLAVGGSFPHWYDVMDSPEKIPKDYSDISNYEDHLVISHEDASPFLTATFEDAEEQSFPIIPSTWAKEAYASEALHDTLNADFGNLDVAEFLLDAKAVPEVERDPLLFGLVHGIYEMRSHMTYDDSDNFSRVLAEFDMEDFKAFCKDSSFNLEKQMQKIKSADDAYALEGEVWSRAELYFYDALYEGKLPKETPLTRELREVLQASSLDDMAEKLEGFLRGEKTTFHRMDKQGRASAPAR